MQFDEFPETPAPNGAARKSSPKMASSQNKLRRSSSAARKSFFQSCRILPHIFIPPSLPTDASIGNKRGQITSSMLLVFQHTAPNCHSASALSRHNKNNISHFGLDARNKKISQSSSTHTMIMVSKLWCICHPHWLRPQVLRVMSVNGEHARANILFDPWKTMTMLNDKKKARKKES